MKYKPARPEYKLRELQPKVKQTKAGVALMCPFCTPSHPLPPGTPTSCGTSLKITAVQVVFPSHTTKHHKLTCIKCHQTGGEMVQFNNSYVHLKDCMPGTRLLTTPPKFQGGARLVFNLPMFVRKLIEKNTGPAQQVKEIDAKGEPTGKILGYFFLKKGVENG